MTEQSLSRGAVGEHGRGRSRGLLSKLLVGMFMAFVVWSAVMMLLGVIDALHGIILL